MPLVQYLFQKFASGHLHLPPPGDCLLRPGQHCIPGSPGPRHHGVLQRSSCHLCRPDDAIRITISMATFLTTFSWTHSKDEIHQVPVLVAISALGGLSCHMMASSRLCFVGARQGHFPDALSLITLDTFTPKPALVFLGGLSLLYLGVGDIYTLINYAAFVGSLFILVSISGLLYLRYRRPDMERPIKVSDADTVYFG